MEAVTVNLGLKNYVQELRSFLQLSSATAICQKMTEEIKRTAKNDRSKDKTVLWFVILKAIINK